MVWGIVFLVNLRIHFVEYMIKRKRATAKMYSAAALFLFFLFLLWVEFSLYPYLNGFILPSIRFPIFR